MKRLLLFIFGIQTVILFGQDSTRIIGHRGCRGLLPENSIISFQRALELGADGVELDVVVNKDKQLVISHEPYFQSSFCLDSSGNRITNERAFNIYKLSQEEIRRFDCGIIGNPKFPEQQKVSASKPLFSEFISQVDMKGKVLLFEVKSFPVEYGKSQPFPSEYASIIWEELKIIPDSVELIVMSFDVNILEELHRKDPDLRITYLTYLPMKSGKRFLKELSFLPYAIGMFHPTIRKWKIRQLDQRGVKTFAWTVNDKKRSEKLSKMGVDAILTDFPDRILQPSR